MITMPLMNLQRIQIIEFQHQKQIFQTNYNNKNKNTKKKQKSQRTQFQHGQAQKEEITLKDSAKYKFKKFEVSGNSEQETREGYNLLNYDTLTSRTTNGITYTINDDMSITASGTATANATLNLIGAGSVYPLSLEAGDYLLSGCDGGSKDTYMIEIYDGTRYLRCINGSTLINFLENTAIRAYITVKSGITLDNVTFYPMLHRGTEEKEYEQCGAMPSPLYSSAIKNCKNNINLKVQNKNYASTKILKDMKLSAITNVSENSFTIDLSKRSNLDIK